MKRLFIIAMLPLPWAAFAQCTTGKTQLQADGKFYGCVEGVWRKLSENTASNAMAGTPTGITQNISGIINGRESDNTVYQLPNIGWAPISIADAPAHIVGKVYYSNSQKHFYQGVAGGLWHQLDNDNPPAITNVSYTYTQAQPIITASSTSSQLITTVKMTFTITDDIALANVSIDWGDGTPAQSLSGSGTSATISFTHVYLNSSATAGPTDHTVLLKVIDNIAQSTSQNVTVTYADPRPPFPTVTNTSFVEDRNTACAGGTGYFQTNFVVENDIISTLAPTIIKVKGSGDPDYSTVYTAPTWQPGAGWCLLKKDYTTSDYIRYIAYYNSAGFYRIVQVSFTNPKTVSRSAAANVKGDSGTRTVAVTAP